MRLTVLDVPIVERNLLHTPSVIWLPSVTDAFNIVLLKRFFDPIPKEFLDEVPPASWAAGVYAAGARFCLSRDLVSSGVTYTWSAEPAAVVLDLDVAENVGPGRLAGLPDGRPDLRLQGGEPAFRGGVVVTRADASHRLPHAQLVYLGAEFVTRVFTAAIRAHDPAVLQAAASGRHPQGSDRQRLGRRTGSGFYPYA